MKRIARAACLTSLFLASFAGCAVESEPTSLAASAQALTVGPFGWAYVHSNGVAGWPYVYNRSGGSVVSSRLATGQYVVDFNGIPKNMPQSPHAVAYGSNAHCKFFTIPQGNGTKTTLYVNCYTPAGALTDSAFVVTLKGFSGTTPDQGAFLSASGGTSPSITNSWNSTGGVNTVAWNAAGGYYTATLPGLTLVNLSVQATAYGANPNRCKVQNWGAGFVNVKCFDAAGAAVPAGFTLSVDNMALYDWRVGGHAWVSANAVNAGYTASRRTNGTGGPLTAATAGSFEVVTLESAIYESLEEVVPMVTSYGSGNDYCSIGSWTTGPVATTVRVNVRCYDATGATIPPAQSHFDLTLSSHEYEPPG